VERGDVSVDAKKFLDVVVGYIGGQVFYVNVVEFCSFFVSLLLVELFAAKWVLVSLSIKGVFGGPGLLKTYETVAARAMVAVKRNFAKKKWTELGEELF
jgi:hypothetical protein